MAPVIGYRSKPAESAVTNESRRRAMWCFIGAGVLAVVGLAVLACAVLIFIGGWRHPTRFPLSSNRLGAVVAVGAFAILGAALRSLNASFYHRSGFETRHRK